MHKAHRKDAGNYRFFAVIRDIDDLFESANTIPEGIRPGFDTRKGSVIVDWNNPGKICIDGYLQC